MVNGAAVDDEWLNRVVFCCRAHTACGGIACARKDIGISNKLFHHSVSLIMMCGGAIAVRCGHNRDVVGDSYNYVAVYSFND